MRRPDPVPSDAELFLLATEQRIGALGLLLQDERRRRAALERHLAALPPPPDLMSVHRRLDGQQVLIEEQRQLIAVQQRTIEARTAEAAAVGSTLDALLNSSAWRMTWPLRRTLDRVPRLARLLRRLGRGSWWLVTLQLPARLRQRAAHRRTTAIAPSLPPPSLSPLVAPERQDDGPGASNSSDAEPDAGPGRPADDPAVPLPPEPPALALPTSATPVVSVVVPCFGQVAATLRCLRAIAASDTRTPFEVIVAEDASGDPAVALLDAVSGIVLLHRERNLGFLRNCNDAVRHARGRFVLLLNNDTEPLPGFLDALHRLMEARPDAGLVGSRLLFPDGTLQEAGGIIWQDGTGWNYGRGEDPELPRFNTVRDTDYVSGASIMLRRDLWDELGGFDPRYAPAYYEDADLAFQVRARGLRVLYQPASTVIHHEGLSHGTDPAAGIKAHQEINRHRLLARWPNLLQHEHLAPGTDPVRAAEHGRGRRVVLVIDHYVPEPDRDAGSRSMLAILRALRGSGRVVKFWPQNREHNHYTALLEVMGIEVLDAREPGGFVEWIHRHGAVLDQVIVARPTVAVEFASALMAHTRARLCFYGVDVHHRRMRRQAELAGDRDLLREALAMEKLERRLWGVFDAVFYPSEEEAAIVRGAVPGVASAAIVAFCFERFAVRVFPPAAPVVLFVAGFAHPPNVDAACWLVEAVLPILRRSCPEVRLVLAGSHPTERVRALAGEAVEITGTLSEAELQARYDVARVAVVPLRVGAGVKGKVVEALQQGIPLVTTPIGAEGLPELDRVAVVTDTAAGIAAAVGTLLVDDGLWNHRSVAGRNWVRERFGREAFEAALFRALDDPVA